jgi:hypothetical protein
MYVEVVIVGPRLVTSHLTVTSCFVAFLRSLQHRFSISYVLLSKFKPFDNFIVQGNNSTEQSSHQVPPPLFLPFSHDTVAYWKKEILEAKQPTLS